MEKHETLGTPEAVVGGMEGGPGPTGMPPTTAAAERAEGSGPRASGGNGRQRTDIDCPRLRRPPNHGRRRRGL